MKKFVVAGGGVAGIGAALTLAEKGHPVVLIEAENECGGLLRSMQNANGDWFDYGTHILKETGVPGLDALLFENVTSTDWRELDYLNVGNVFHGHLNPNSQFPDLSSLPSELFLAGLYDCLKQTEDVDETEENLAQYFRQKFGSTWADEVFAPIVQKVQNAELSSLHKNSAALLGLARVIIGTPEMQRELKKSKPYDQRFGFSSSTEGISDLKNFYPRTGGIGVWIEQLLKSLKNRGVEILTNTRIEQIESQNGEATAVIVEQGQKIECQRLIWTLPAALGIKALSEKPENGSRPSFMKTLLFNFVFKEKFLTDNHYLMVNDPNLNSFRITLYSNLQDSDIYRCSVEMICRPDHPALSSDRMTDIIHKELAEMKVVSLDNEVLSAEQIVIPSGFPVFTTEFFDNVRSQSDQLEKLASNVSVMGRNSGRLFFMNDILVDLYKRLG